MLKYSYSLSLSSNSQDVILDDLYVSPDLTFISGTTTNTHVCSAGDKLWVRSPYFPNEQLTRVTTSEIVKRNGFVMVPKKLSLQRARTYILSDSGTTVSYVEYNGNTYFTGASGDTFYINGEYCEPENNSVIIHERIYIENDKLTVNGVTFNALVSKKDSDEEYQLYLTDFVGNNYVIPSTWNCSGVTGVSENVLKLSIGENTRNIIDCNSVTYYGHRPYIVYQSENKYLEYFYDGEGNITGAGAKIDGVEYPCDALFVMFDNDWEHGYNLYDINSYYTNDNGKAVITIDGDKYIIYFESGEMYGTGIIGIETAITNPSILKGDRISVHNVGVSSKVIVRYDKPEAVLSGDTVVSGDTGCAYVYIDGRRYNGIKNLCDSVILGDSEYMLTYDGDCENPTIDTILSTETNNGDIIYFKFSEGEGGQPFDIDRLKRVEYINGEWRDCYTMIDTESGVTYSNTARYQINHGDGFMIGDYKAKIYHYDYERNDDASGNEMGLVIEQYDYIILDSSLGYRLKVIGTDGGNRLLCIPDIDITTYTGFSKEQLADEILYSIQGNTFVIEKRANYFGTTDLYYDTWMSQAVQLDTPSSVYELANVENAIRLTRKRSHFTIPVGLSKRISNNMEYENLITNQYYDEEAEIAINPIIDMEKDMYSPVIKEGNKFEALNEIVFNLHFRTRDLETWKVIEDEGTYNISGNTQQVLTANYQYCNWFVTDYYPFYQYARNNNIFDSEEFKKVITRSDLLGFLYFTTDDVKSSRDKLEKSFLRLTFFDSKNPEKQNMLGTSTIYFDCDRYLDLLNKKNEIYHYEECFATRNTKRADDYENNYEKSQNYEYYCDSAPDDSKKIIKIIGYEPKEGDIINIKFKNPTNTYATLYIYIGKKGANDWYFDGPIYLGNTYVDASTSWKAEEVVQLVYKYPVWYWLKNKTVPTYSFCETNSENSSKIYYCESESNSSIKNLGRIDSIYDNTNTPIKEGTVLYVKFKHSTTEDDPQLSIDGYIPGNTSVSTWVNYIYINGEKVKTNTSWKDNQTVKLVFSTSNNGSWIMSFLPESDIMCTTYNKPTVLKQAFVVNNIDIIEGSSIMSGATKHLYIGDDNVVLDSRITVRDRYSDTNISSEGFDTYILKAFGDKKKPQTIYMKAEFFHAGVGIKIPMILPTNDKNNAISEWKSKEYEDFLKGYDLNSVFDRLYIPIIIEYSRSLKKFVYHVSDENNYLNCVLDGNKKRWMFNMFELKIKSN